MSAVINQAPKWVENFSSYYLLFSAKLVYYILLLTFLISLLLTPELKAQDLIISKTGPSTANPGDIINYTITYQNVSGDFATNVEITDFLPSKLNGTLISSNPAGITDADSTTIIWTSTEIPNLAKLDKESYSIAVQFRVGLPDGSFSPAGFYIPSTPLTLENYAQIKSDEAPTPVQSNSVETIVTQFCGTNNLPTLSGEIKSSGGSFLLRLIAITNTGNVYDRFEINLSEGAGLSEVLLKQILDSDRNSVSGAAAISASATTDWLAPGETALFFIKLLVDQVPAQTHNYTDVTISSVVCNSLLQSATMNTFIHNPSDPLIYILKTVSPAKVKSGDTLYYTLLIYNNTNADIAEDVVLTENYPSGTTFLSAVPPPDTGNNTWDLGDIGEFEEREVKIAVTINANNLCADEVIVNTASVNYLTNPGAPISCTASTLIEATPLAVSNITSTNISCNGLSDGTVTVDATGAGSIDYNLWFSAISGGPYTEAAADDGDTDGSYTGLPLGFYKVRITDDCPNPWIPIESIEVYVANPLITLAASITAITNPLCVESNILTATVLGGLPPYSFDWSSSNSGLIVDPTATALDYTPPIGFAGDVITLTVTDFCSEISIDSETVSIIQTATPSGNTNQTFCEGATVANLVAIGLDIQWYDAASGGNLLANSEALIDGNIYYATQTDNGCESYVRLPVTAYINFVSGGIITDNQNVCAADTPNPFTEIASSLSSGTLSYQWRFSLDGIAYSNIIVNGTSALYNPIGSPFELNYYKRISTSTLNGIACSSESNVLLITFDIHPPLWDFMINDTTVECDDIPFIHAPTATDVMDPNPSVSYTDVSTQTTDGPCNYTIYRTWIATDACGNSATQVQNISVVDNTAPEASDPLPLTIDCISNAPPDITVVIDETDNCGPPTVTWVSDVSDGNACPEIITRTYSVTDDCGNSINVTQIITVNDITNPSASSPPPLIVECSGDAPPDINVITDEADNCGTPTVAFVNDVSDGLSCPETIIRTYSVTDDCGNTIDVYQTITILDTTAPTASNPPALIIDCIDNLPAVDVLIVTDEADNCTAIPAVAFVSDVSDNASCPETITRTYSVTDDCGNTLNVTQSIIINDDIAPTASNPADISVFCFEDIPTEDILIISDEADNCTANPLVEHLSDAPSGPICTLTMLRTYRVSDDCGNFIDLTQNILVQDTVAPTASNPPNIVLKCLNDAPIDISVVTDEADNCTINPLVEFISDVDNGGSGCVGDPLIVNRTYRVSDNCGNFIDLTQTILVEDNIAPVVSDPVDVIIETCSTDDINNPKVGTSNLTYSTTAVAISITQLNGEGITASDNCNIASITYIDVSNGGACPEVITRTFAVSDNCGNTTSVDYTITLEDTTPPEVSEPSDVVIEACSSAYSSNPMAGTSDLAYSTIAVAISITQLNDEGITATDNCNIATITYIDVSNGATCHEVITRTFAITDNCGNLTNVDYTITLEDTTAPEVSEPEDVTIEACNSSKTSDFLDGISDLAYSTTAVSISTTQLFNEGITAADNCHIASINYIDETNGVICPEVITRTFTVSDDCGNITTVDYTITFRDTSFPTASNLPDLHVQCFEEAAIDIEAVNDETDNCTSSPLVEYVGDESDGLSCPETFTRTYQITDICSNSIFVTQRIIVLDTTKPTASNPLPIILESVDDIPLPDIAVVYDATDNCVGRPIVKFVSEVSDTLPLVRTITRQYSVSDYCGNTIFVTQNILINGFPYAVDDHYTIDENSIDNVFDVLENDDFGGDGPGNPIIEIISQPEQGEAFISANPADPTDEFILYTPPCNYYEKDTFEYAITDRSGDQSKATVYIDFIPNPLFIPEGFSPNGDGFNDCFYILGLFYYPMNSIVIFDQNGNTVFEDGPYKNDWEGKDMFNGNLLPQDTYFYLFDMGNGGQKMKGFVYLIRKY